MKSFEAEIFNMWEFKTCSKEYGYKYPGRIPGQIVENLVHYYTKEEDIILDPFAGSGTSIDVCKKFNRNCIAYDLNPSRPDIIKNDITQGIPLKDKSVQLVFLDPPYSIMKKGEYTGKSTDLSQMDLSTFLMTMDYVIGESFRVLKKNGYIALIIGNLWTSKTRLIDLAYESYKLIKSYGFKEEERVIVPYMGQATSHSGLFQWRARNYKFMLRAYRDLIIGEKING